MAKFKAGQNVFVMHQDRIREVKIHRVITYETEAAIFSNYEVLGIGVNCMETRVKAGSCLFTTKLELMESL